MLQKSSTQNEIKNPTSHLISIYVCVHVSVYANMLRITDTAKWAVWTRTWPFACPWSVRQKKKELGYHTTRTRSTCLRGKLTTVNRQT